MSKTQINLQDNFLNQVRKENIPVILYLTSGVQLRGQVKGFDAFTVILEGQGKPPQLVYKHSIVSVAPMRHPAVPVIQPSAEAAASAVAPAGFPTEAPGEVKSPEPQPATAEASSAL
ncbi:MAG: RNA chaperone Hfq [Armatimonadetes bacterium]|nr:RNA chaperone Hfq [Armatimonadota bacterium]